MTDPGITTVWRWALREARGGVRHFRIFLVCLAVGVGLIVAVVSLNHSLSVSLMREGRTILGGDIEARLIHRPLPRGDRQALGDLGAVSTIVEMRAMAVAPGAEPALVELKAIDGAYPLYGELESTPAAPLDDLLADDSGRWGALVDPVLLDRLDVDVGDSIRLGAASLWVAGVIQSEPDLASEGFMLGPRLMISRAALAATNLIVPGSLATYRYRVKLPPGTDAARVRRGLETRFLDMAVRLRDYRNAAPGVAEFFDRAGFFLMLAALISLLVGGIGIASGTYFYLDTRRQVIATLKSLGARQRDVTRLYVLVVLMMGTIGILAGVVLGLGGTAVGMTLIAEKIPFRAQFVAGAGPIALSMLAGYLIVIGFAGLPLGRIGRIGPASLFRQIDTGGRGRRMGWTGLVAGLASGALIALVVLLAPEPAFVLYFLAGTTLVAAILWGIGTVVTRLLRRLPRPGAPRLNLALGNLARPGHGVRIIILSLGLGMSLLVALTHVRHSLEMDLARALPANAPSFFLTDVRRADYGRLADMLNSDPAIETFEAVPMIRGRIVRINGQRPDAESVPEDVRWILRGDRGFTFAEAPPENARIVRGRWWPEADDGPPQVSVEAEAARGLGLEIGDTLTVNILGRPITAEIANWRAVDWRSLAINFVVVFSPDALAAAPYHYLATVTVPPEHEGALARKLGAAFPNLTIIRIKAVLEEARALLGKVGMAIALAAGVTILCGTLVVAGATAAGFRQRLRETAILRTLGATARDIRIAFLAEFMLIGALVGALSIGAGTAGAYLVVTFFMPGDWYMAGGSVAAVVIGVLTGAVIFALAAYRRVMQASVMPVLRIP